MTANILKLPNASKSALSRVRSVSQVVLTLRSDKPKEAFQAIRNKALIWLGNRAGRPLPKHAWNGDTFDMLEVGAQPVSAIGLENIWCFRIVDADKEVARRSWTTEVGILLTGSGDVLFGCRLQCVALGDSPQFDATIPGIVGQIVSQHASFLDNHRISTRAWHVSSDEEVDALVELLVNQNRTRPVIVASLGDKDGHDGPAVIDTDDLARLTIGAAHVVALTGKASFAITHRLGKEFSVFHRAVRTYRAPLNIDDDSPADHPIALPDTIDEWNNGGGGAFKRFLADRALRDTVVGVDIYKQLPSFAEIHALALKQRRNNASEHGASDKELLALALEENDSLHTKLKEEKETYNGLLQSGDADRRQIEGERDQARTNNRSLQARMTYLEAALRSGGKKENDPIPESFESLEDWCRKMLSGYVYVMPRAIRNAGKSNFEKPDLAYKTLIVLRDYFVPMKLEGGLELKIAYEGELKALGLEESPSFAGSRAGEQGDEFKVSYNGQPHYLDRHIQGSNSRDERFGFRLYFFWDDGSQQAVVGSFPGHLTTRAT